MKDITRRKNTGRPGNGGKFDGKTNSVPEGGLTNLALDPVSAEVTFDWIERNVLPTHSHRIPRNIERKGRATIRIPSVTAADAPVGFGVVRNETEYRNLETGEVVSKAEARRLQWNHPKLEVQRKITDVTREYRVHEGVLYREVLDGQRPDGTTPATPDWISTRATRSWKFMCDGDTEEEAAADAQAQFAGYLSIDGTLWEATREPVYQIHTFGLGNNYGGTALGVSIAPVTDEHAAGSFYIPADHYEEAVARAVEVAEKRGDTASLESIRETPRIDVAAPELVASTWRPATVIPDRPRPYELTPGQFPRELAGFRHDIATIPGAVEEADDGFGGKSHRVNYAALSETQEYDYKSFLQYGAEKGLL